MKDEKKINNVSGMLIVTLSRCSQVASCPFLSSPAHRDKTQLEKMDMFNTGDFSCVFMKIQICILTTGEDRHVKVESSLKNFLLQMIMTTHQWQKHKQPHRR